MLGTIRIRMDALVQLRGSTQRQCPEKPYRNQRRHKGAPVIV